MSKDNKGFQTFWKRLTIPDMAQLSQLHIELIRKIASRAYKAGLKDGQQLDK